MLNGGLKIGGSQDQNVAWGWSETDKDDFCFCFDAHAAHALAHRGESATKREMTLLPASHQTAQLPSALLKACRSTLPSDYTTVGLPQELR